MVPGLRWLCSLMHTSGLRSAFRGGLPWAPTTQFGLFCAGHSSGRDSRQRRASTAVCHGPRAHPRAAAVNLGARTGLKHHNVERDVSSELCRRSTLRVCRGVSVPAVSIWAKTSVVRRRFSGRDWSGAPRRSCLIFVLMLSSDHSGRNARISRGITPSLSHWRT